VYHWRQVCAYDADLSAFIETLRFYFSDFKSGASASFATLAIIENRLLTEGYHFI
jgi:hypothetical protein